MLTDALSALVRVRQRHDVGERDVERRDSCGQVVLLGRAHDLGVDHWVPESRAGAIVAMETPRSFARGSTVMVGLSPSCRSGADGAFVGDVLGPSIVASVGFGLCLRPVVSTATVGAAPHETGTASGLLNSSRQIGASLGLAALDTAAEHRTGGTATAQALNHGYAPGRTSAPRSWSSPRSSPSPSCAGATHRNRHRWPPLRRAVPRRPRSDSAPHAIRP